MGVIDYQRMWDEQMLGCWVTDASYSTLVSRYSDAVGIELAGLDDIGAHFDSVGLVRCHMYSCGDMRLQDPVRAVVARCCSRLSGLLFSGHKPDELLPAMPAFIWKPMSMATRAHKNNIRSYKKRKARGEDVRIKARELSNDRWDKVK